MHAIKNAKKGFTLTELLVCLAILVALSAITIPIVIGLVDKADDKEDTLMAKMYTNCVVRYANEVPQPVDTYTNLLASDRNIASNAGKGNYPGFEYLNAPTENESIESIQKCMGIAIKMYGENANVKNDYTVDAPRNSKNDFIYYYLSGKVAVKSVEDAQKETTKNLSSGNAGALENYWVCLNKPNVGSNPGIASAPTDPDTYKTHGDVYITLYYEATDTVANEIDVSNIRLYGADSIPPTSMSGNTVFFENVPVGAYAIIINEGGIVPMNPSEPFYKDKKVVVEEDGDYYGCSASKPKSIYLKKLAYGTVKFTETSDYWSVRSSDCTNTPRTTSPTIIDGELKFIDTVKNITRKFSVDSASLSITSSDVGYIPEGEYQMVFTSSNYEEVRQKITATESGFKIDGEIQQELSINLTTKKKFDTSVEIAVTSAVANRVSNGNLFLTLNLGAGEITVPFTASRSEYLNGGNVLLHFDINEENISEYINNNVDVAALYGKCIIYVVEGGSSTRMGEIYLYPAKKTEISINGFSLR